MWVERYGDIIHAQDVPSDGRVEVPERYLDDKLREVYNRYGSVYISRQLDSYTFEACERLMNNG
jgi:hypothetical protein